jgi:hypothetical protein
LQVAVAQPPSDDVALRYLGGFALSLPLVALPPLLLALGVRAAAARAVEARRQFARRADAYAPSATEHSARGVARGMPSFLRLPCALAGLATGGLWAAGNVLSVHAAMRLGQAVGFPLTQVCVVVSALYGVFVFGELRARAARVLFGASSAVVLAGAAALKMSGG